MITQSTAKDKVRRFHEGDYWIEMGGKMNRGATTLYHTCSDGRVSNVLYNSEVRARECTMCGPLNIPDDLWTLYVLLGGRGAI